MAKTLLFIMVLTLGAIMPTSSPLAAQRKASKQASTWPDVEQLRLAWPDEDALFLERVERLDIRWVDDEPSIVNAHNSRLLFLTEHARGLAERSVPYSSFSEIMSLDAQTWVPDEKKRYVAQEVTDIRDAENQSPGVFYGDQREKRLVFPGVQAGAIAALSYTERILEPRFLGAFMLGGGLPTLQSRYDVAIDPGFTLRYRLLGSDTSGVVFTVDSAGGRITYSWEVRNRPAADYWPDAPPLRTVEPHVMVYLERLGQNSLLDGVPGLYAWYRELTEQLNAEPDPFLQQITADVIDNAEDDTERARRIFHWVQDHIRYIAFEDGLGGFIPREAALVCSRKYGDCKDMASLTTAMLHLAGIPASLVWIGTRDIPYRYDEVPTPMVDNHMIAAAQLNGEWVWLDATDAHLGFGMPSEFIQGKQALVGQGDDFALVDVPVLPAKANRTVEQAVFRLEGDAWLGEGTAIFNGYPAVNLRHDLAGRSPEGQGRFFNERLQLGNNKFQVSDWAISGQEQRDDSLTVLFDFQLPDYARVVGDAAYVNLHLDRRWWQASIDTARTQAKDFPFRWQHDHRVALLLPEGFGVDYLPPNVVHEGPGFGFAIRYEKQADQVVLHRTLTLDRIQLTSADFPAWNQMIELLEEAYQDVVVLVRH